MSKNLKRIIAYMLDMFLVTAIVFALTNIKQINFQLTKHNKASKEYSEIVKKYEKEEAKFNKVKKKYDKDKIKKSEYKKAEKKLESYKKEYAENIKKYNYELTMNSVFPTVMSMCVVILYFGILQYFMNGQTLGKKLMKIRVVKNKEGKLNIVNFILRCIILNGIIANLLIVLFVYIFNANDFYNASYIVSNAQSIVEFIILIMIFMTKDNRGLHDFIASTRVVELDALGNIIEEVTEDEKIKETSSKEEVVEVEIDEKNIKEKNDKINKKIDNNKKTKIIEAKIEEVSGKDKNNKVNNKKTTNVKKSTTKKKKEVSTKNKKNKKEEL